MIYVPSRLIPPSFQFLQVHDLLIAADWWMDEGQNQRALFLLKLYERYKINRPDLPKVILDIVSLDGIPLPIVESLDAPWTAVSSPTARPFVDCLCECGSIHQMGALLKNWNKDYAQQQLHIVRLEAHRYRLNNILFEWSWGRCDHCGEVRYLPPGAITSDPSNTTFGVPARHQTRRSAP